MVAGGGGGGIRLIYCFIHFPCVLKAAAPGMYCKVSMFALYLSYSLRYFKLIRCQIMPRMTAVLFQQSHVGFPVAAS